MNKGSGRSFGRREDQRDGTEVATMEKSWRRKVKSRTRRSPFIRCREVVGMLALRYRPKVM